MAARFVLLPDGGNNVDVMTPTGVVNLTTSAGGGGGGSVNSVTANAASGPLVTVNNTDPTNPVVTTQASEYTGEQTRGNGSGGWERATDGVIAATTINSRPTDGSSTLELVSAAGGHLHFDAANPTELLATANEDLNLSSNGANAHTNLQANGAGGRRTGVEVAVFNDGVDHTVVGFFGGTPQQQSPVTGTTPTDALNSLLSILNANSLVGAVPTVVDQKILGFWGAVSANAAVAARFLDFGNVRDTSHPTDESSAMVMPQNGSLTAIFVHHANALTTDSVAYTVQKNGVDTTLTCTVAANTTAANDTAHTVAFVAGDRIGIKSVQSGTQAGATMGASVGLCYKSS